MPPTPTEHIDPQDLAGRPVYLVDPVTGERVRLVAGAVPVSGGGGGGGTVNQGTPAVPANAWPVKPTDAAGVNQAAITAAGDTKVTLDDEQPKVKIVSGDGSGLVAAVISTGVGGNGMVVTGQVAVSNNPDPATGTSQLDGNQRTQIVGDTGVNRAKVTVAGNLQVTIAASSATVATTGTTSDNSLVGNLSVNTNPARANAAVPAWTENGRVPLSVDLSGRARVDGSGVTQPVSAAALPLPAGAATSALQTQPGVDIGDVTINNLGGAAAVPIQDGGNSITVDATALPLPTGAATDVKQDVGNLSLSSLDSKIGTLESKPSAYSVLDRLYQLGLKLDAINKAQALEADLLRKIPPPAPAPTVLLLRHPISPLRRV